jgi:hypothetical protein
MNKEKSNEINCLHNNFKRTRYFHGMLMTDRDFKEEQIYHNEKRKLLNKMLHGWGVVCGLEIKPTPTPSSIIKIKPGLALDCKGNEIYVSEEYSLNIEKILKSGSGPKMPAKLCETNTETIPRTLYIIIRCKEIYTDQVPIYAPGGGCEEKACESSRIQEGYCIELVKEINPKCCPKPLRNPEDKDNPCTKLGGEDSVKDEAKIRTFLCEDFLMPCPGECCDDSYVVLGSITLTMTNVSGTEFEPIESSMINNWDCRKYVMSFGLLQHWMTLLAPQTFQIESIVDYAGWKDSCVNVNTAANRFNTDICPKTTLQAEPKIEKEIAKEKTRSTKKS